MRREVLTFPITALAFVAVVDALQDADIRGANIALVLKTIAVRTVTIENRRQSRLLAWAIRTTGAPGAGSVVNSSDFTWQMVGASDSGPIEPGQQRVLEVLLTPGTSSPPPILDLAVFADGVIDGTAEGIARWRNERRERAEDAWYWRDAFAKMPRESEERAKAYLAARVAERSAVAPTDHSGTRGRLFRLWHETPQPPGFVFAIVEYIEKEAARQAEVLTRTLAARQSLESAAPVSITLRPSTRTAYVVTIINLRDSPIEAVAFDYYLPSTDRPSGGDSMDFCTTDRPARDGRGRIAPGETREFPFSREIPDPGRLATVRLRYVLFDDLSFEGRGADRDELFRRREDIADDMAFANRVRAELTNVADGDLHEFLQKKKAERIARLLSLKRLPSASALDRMIEDAARSPARLRETAAAVVAHRRREPPAAAPPCSLRVLMKRFRLTVVAAAVLVTCAVPVAQSAATQGVVTWLVFVDDLHLDFRNTGRLRDLLRMLSGEVIRTGDRFAVRSSGPSMLSVDITQDQTLLASALRRATGSGLSVSDIARGGRNEARDRATVALATMRAAISALGQAPAGRRGLIYVSNGYPGGDPLRDQVQEVARFAQETGVTIFALDPRGLPGAIVADPRVDPLVWKDYLTATRETLRMLSQPTGGFALFEFADVSQALDGIGAAMRK